MALKRRILLVLTTAILTVTGCQNALKTTSPSLGELQHRGQRYALRDLADQAYREASNDPFVRNFDPETVWAVNDAPSRRGQVSMAAEMRIPALPANLNTASRWGQGPMTAEITRFRR